METQREAINGMTGAAIVCLIIGLLGGGAAGYVGGRHAQEKSDICQVNMVIGGMHLFAPNSVTPEEAERECE